MAWRNMARENSDKHRSLARRHHIARRQGALAAAGMASINKRKKEERHKSERRKIEQYEEASLIRKWLKYVAEIFHLSLLNL